MYYRYKDKMNPVLTVFIILLTLAITPSILQSSFATELPGECTRHSSSDHSNSHLLRMLDLDNCFPEQFTKKELVSKVSFSNNIIDFCDNLYHIYQAVDEQTFFTFGKMFSRNCILLYEAPMYNSTDNDRQLQLYNHVQNNIKQHTEETKDERYKSVENARLSFPVITRIYDMFEAQLEKIESLENQLLEQNKPIPSTTQIQLQEEKLIECLITLKDKSIHVAKKIPPLKECAEIDNLVGIGIDATGIIKSKAKKISGNFLSYCEYSYPMYLILSLQDYYDSVKHPFTRYCPFLFEHPIWSYQESDRDKVLNDFIIEKLEEHLSQSDDFRKKSVSEAVINTGRLMILKELYELQNQKIELLQSKLEK